MGQQGFHEMTEVVAEIPPSGTLILETGYIPCSYSKHFASIGVFHDKQCNVPISNHELTGKVFIEATDDGYQWGDLVNAEVDLSDPLYKRPNMCGYVASMRANAHSIKIAHAEAGTTRLIIRSKNGTEVMATKFPDGTFGWFATELITAFTSLPDTPDFYDTHGGKYVAVKADATGLEFVNAPTGGQGADTLLGLTDTPASYVNMGGKLLAVNAATNGVEFVDPPTGEGAHAPLPEANITNADKYVIVKSDGSGYTVSEETVTEVNTIMTGMVAGIQNGNQLINLRCMGGDTMMSQQDIPATTFCSGNAVISTTTNGAVRTLNMGSIVGYQSASLTNTEIREGCLVTIANMGNAVLRMEPPAEHMIAWNNTDYGQFNLKPYHTAILFPAITNDGSKKFIILSLSRCDVVADNAEISTHLTQLDNSISRINGTTNTQGIEIGKLKTLTTNQGTRITTAETNIKNNKNSLEAASSNIIALQTAIGNKQTPAEGSLWKAIADMQAQIDALKVWHLEI